MLKKLHLAAAVSWTAVIFFLCLIKSSDLPVINIVSLDKVVHAFFHLVFVMLWFLYLKLQFKSSAITKPLLFSFALSVFCGITIEIAQQIVTTTRSADVLDVVANILGATIGAAIISAVTYFIGIKTT